MQQLTTVWLSLSFRQRMLIVISTIAMFAAVMGLSQMAVRPSMALLYASVDPKSAGGVVAALEQRDAIYEVRGESIYVAAIARDELRMALAAEGLPAGGSQGYELLDTLSGFGTTSQMFDAAYWRAKEGELARTILVNPNIRTARVHLSHASSQPFSRNKLLSASVTISQQGGRISANQARALKYLVASSVSGLKPEGVAIIDVNAGMIIDDQGASTGLVSQNDRVSKMQSSVERILEARVGVGNAIVELNIETVTDKESIFERTFDPDSRVVISTETEERATNANDSGPGNVTVASNLPDGDAGEGENVSSSENSETRERTNYEVSETKRELIKSTGSIKRLSVAVLVNEVRTVNAEGIEKYTIRDVEELSALRDLVASSVGFNEERGDTITLKSMMFQPLSELGTVAENPLFSLSATNIMTIIQAGILGLVAIILGLFVVRPILSNQTAERTPPSGKPAIAPPLPISPMPDFEFPRTQPSLDGPEENKFNAPELSTVTDFDLPELNQFPNLPIASSNSGEHGSTSTSNDPVARLREMIQERQEETVATLKSWMEDKEAT